MNPTMQEARSRQTAMEAERHWWVSRLAALQHRCESRGDTDTTQTWAYEAFRLVATEIDALIQERTR